MTDSLAQARMVLRSVLDSSASDFYRRKYGQDARVASVLAGGPWEMLPTLSRADIQGTPVWERLYTGGRRDIEAIRPTSGTSGRGLILVPRLSYDAGQWRHHFYDDVPMRRLASYSGAQFLYDFSTPAHPVDTVQLVPGDGAMSAVIIERFDADALAGFPYALTDLAGRLSAERRTAIQGIQFFGEGTTTLEWEYLKRMFPNAAFYVEYASVELQTPAAASCTHMARAREPYVHPIAPLAHVELLDEAGRPVTEVGARGELVVTVLRPVMFPLIRYRTGDMARIVRADCPCGEQTPLLAVEGRLDADRVRILGGEVQAAEVDRALASMSDELAGHAFEARVGEVTESDVPLPQLTIVCALRPGISPEVLARRLAARLRVAPDRTWAQGVAEGKYAPLTILNEAPAPVAGKRVRLVRV